MKEQITQMDRRKMSLKDRSLECLAFGSLCGAYATLGGTGAAVAITMLGGADPGEAYNVAIPMIIGSGLAVGAIGVGSAAITNGFEIAYNKARSYFSRD